MDNHTYVSLLRAVRAHSGMSLAEIREAAEHGADCGFPGFTYTSDGADFTRAHRDTIWAMLADEADDLGYPNPCAFVGTFARADMTATPEGTDCLLAWYALESVGARLCDRARR
jgi:hypothetical protein